MFRNFRFDLMLAVETSDEDQNDSLAHPPNACSQTPKPSFSIENSSYSIMNWIECPSFYKSEETFKQKIFQMIGTSRCAAFMRLSTLMPQDIYTHEQRKAFLSPSSLDVIPLFRSISASIIQIITNVIPRFFTDQKKISEIVTDYFLKNSIYADLFSTVTFPAIFFYFSTTEFSELGSIFLENCLSIVHSSFTSNLLASYFDCYPRFTETLWLTFESNYPKKSVFNSFLDAISVSFRQLTPNHSRLIHILNDADPEFLSEFFFREYFQPRAHMKYYTASGDRYLAVLVDLLSILNFAALNYGSPHQKILLSAIINAHSSSTQELSYSNDIQLPTVYALLSGVEISFLREMILDSDLIKYKKTLQESTIPENKAISMAPGYIQFSSKQILSHSKRQQMSILFNLYPKENKSSQMKNSESNQAMNHDANTINSNNNISNEINHEASADNGRRSSEINENTRNSENENEGETEYENENIQNEKENSAMKRKTEQVADFDRLWNKLVKMAHDEGQSVNDLINNPKSMDVRSVVNSSIVQSTHFRQFMLEKLTSQISNSEKAFEVFIARLQTQRELARICEDFKRDSRMYMWKNAQEYVLNNCIAQGSYADSTHETVIPSKSTFMAIRYQESLTFHKLKEPVNVPPHYPTANKLKSKYFEDLLKYITLKDNMPQFIYHFVLTLLNEWPYESEQSKEIIQSFRSFSDKRRCILAEDKKVVSMVANNAFVLKVFRRMQKLRELKLGNQIAEIVHIITQLKLVFIKFYTNNSNLNENNFNDNNLLDNHLINKYENKNNVNNNDVENTTFEEFACNCFFFAGVDELIISFIWFTRLASNFREYINALQNETIETFIGVTRQMFFIVKEFNPKLSVFLNESVLKIPQCDNYET
ncbi:hypothetical protein TRFO_33550 [Tritrichomonas foetus]|uniref:Uncharacterized protein n=1 Tax=Tritrichomonas foetus TaxID=1144522 RepID=A0A1J4JRR5_9EUKA|nr:hypothetical protein TRFO_33550 [Tritrichomonas foetus]|eukprot:OHS99940.1 hypothetical protein TRFO_33550 [Tritrichomonas foetus]